VETVTQRVQVRSRLLDIGRGLSEEILRDAIVEGEVLRSGCTENDPPCAPGTLMWARIVRALRERLRVEFWTKSDRQNFSTVVAPDGLTAIAVATGDESTGIVDDGTIPCTRHPKGRATRAAVERNKEQLDLFPEARIPSTERESIITTWFLLVRREVDVIRCELSLPEAIAADGRIEKWRTRIILDSVPIAAVGGVIGTIGDPVQADVTVRRRQGGE
jgi:hypothetical protein